MAVAPLLLLRSQGFYHGISNHISLVCIVVAFVIEYELYAAAYGCTLYKLLSEQILCVFFLVHSTSEILLLYLHQGILVEVCSCRFSSCKILRHVGGINTFSICDEMVYNNLPIHVSIMSCWCEHNCRT